MEVAEDRIFEDNSYEDGIQPQPDSMLIGSFEVPKTLREFLGIIRRILDMEVGYGIKTILFPPILTEWSNP